MKKTVIIITCAGLAVLLLGLGIVWHKKTTRYVENITEHIVPDSLNIPNMPVLKFAKTRHDFGSYKKEKKMPINVIHIDFEFQNIGDVPLVIYRADVSCGCLSVDLPKDPTMPKGTGTIKVKVDVQDYTGSFNKTLFVRSNATEDVVLLRIVGQIK